MFFPGHFIKHKNKLILPGIQVLWWIKKNSEQVNFPENSIILQNVSINFLSVC